MYLTAEFLHFMICYFFSKTTSSPVLFDFPIFPAPFGWEDRNNKICANAIYRRRFGLLLIDRIKAINN